VAPTCEVRSQGDFGLCGVILGEDHRSEGGTGMGSGAGDEAGAMPLLLWSGNLDT